MNTAFDSLTGKGVHIAIIDSGVMLEHPALKTMNCTEASRSVLYNKGGEIAFCDDISDCSGHGTAVCGIFARLVPNSSITVIKVFQDDELQVEDSLLIAALDYILSDVECDIVHMSMGSSVSSDKLLDRCNMLTKRGTLIVSAYDNAGGISFPAHYNEVIGVDGDTRLKKDNDFFTILGDNITILAKGSNHRVAWKNPANIIARGSSFSAAYVTAYAAKMLEYGINKNDIPKSFAQISKKAIDMPKMKLPDLFRIPFEITRAIVYPYNKEMHSLVNYADRLSFEIINICDSKYTGRVGKKVSSLNGKNEFTVKDISEVDWNEADTLILGHADQLDRSIGIPTKAQLLSLCIKHNLNIYSFDDDSIDDDSKDRLVENGQHVYIPYMHDSSFTKASMGKLYAIGKPVLCVFGTSSQQGKFTLQLDLRYHLIDKGYNVVQLGSEPSALLYGCDACYPFGYNSTVHASGEEFIASLNAIMHEIDMRTPNGDIIVTGCQSGTIPALYSNLSQLPLSSLYFLIAVMADAAILCVNPDDDIEYIVRSIKAIEGVGACKVIAVCLYPLTYRNSWFAFNGVREPLKNADDIKQKISEVIKLPIFIIGDEHETDKLCEACIDYLAE